MEQTQISRGPGRPRGYDEAEALQAAMRCFWARGYTRVSMGMLSAEMAMPRASIYAKFGGKEGLFLAAIEDYAKTRSGKAAVHLQAQGDAPAEVSAFFEAMIQMVTSDPETPGCLIACVLAEAATLHSEFRAVLAAKAVALEDRFYATLVASNPSETSRDLHAKAGVLAATARGLAVNARAGIGVDALRETARMATLLTCTSAQMQ